jgi:hypothetical protein
MLGMHEDVCVIEIVIEGVANPSREPVPVVRQ